MGTMISTRAKEDLSRERRAPLTTPSDLGRKATRDIEGVMNAHAGRRFQCERNFA